MALQLANGDTIHVEKVAEESNDTVTVVIHPQLGRLEVSSADLQQPAETPAWSSTLAAGVIGVSEDNDDSVTVSMNATSSYTKAADKLVMKADSITKKPAIRAIRLKSIRRRFGLDSIRPKVNESVNWFTSGNYDYNGLNDVSINTLKAAMGAGFPVLKTDSTELILSVGPSLQWSDGGQGCARDAFCGNTYGGGTFTTQLSWVPNRSFKLNLDNNLSVLAANSEAKPTNTFTATIKYFPSFNSGLFTSLQFESIHNSVADPKPAAPSVASWAWNSETDASPPSTPTRCGPCSPSPMENPGPRLNSGKPFMPTMFSSSTRPRKSMAWRPTSGLRTV